MRNFECNLCAALLIFVSLHSLSYGASFAQRNYGKASSNGNPFTISNEKQYRSSNQMARLRSKKKRAQDGKLLDLQQDKRRDMGSLKSTFLSSSIFETPTSQRSSLQPRLKETIANLQEMEWQDLAVVTCYGCNTLALGT